MSKYTGTVLIMDGQPDSTGDAFPPDAQVEIKESVAVTRDFGDTVSDYLGEAKLRREGNEIKYDIELLDELIPDAMARLLRPCVGGSIRKRQDKNIVDFTIRQIGLALDNADTRIKRLGEE
jgi:hypothetical protein